MKKLEKAESLIPFLRTWDTTEMEEAFISFCVDGIESGDYRSKKMYDVVSTVNESWFTNDKMKAAYVAIRKAVLEVDKDGFIMPGSIALRLNAMIMSGILKSDQSGEQIIDYAKSASPLFAGVYSFSVLSDSVIPLWRLKLARRYLRNSAESLVDALDGSPSHELLTTTIPSLIEKQQTIWGSLSKPDEKDEGWENTLNELLQPLPENSTVSTGITVLDNTIQGGIAGPNYAYGGRLIVVAARPAMGKTTAAITLATHLANTGNNVAFFSLEMPRRQIEYKAVSCLDFLRMKDSGRIVDPIRMGNLQNRSYSPAQKERIKSLNASSFVKAFDVFDKSQNAASIASVVRMLARTRPNLRGIFIDYLQLIDGCTGTDNDATAIGVVTKTLKRLAVELGIDIILMSQVNRGVEQRTDKMPTLSDLRASGRIEEDADVVMFLFRPGYYDTEADPYELAISVAKNRGGITGTLQCKIDLASSVIFDRL